MNDNIRQRRRVRWLPSPSSPSTTTTRRNNGNSYTTSNRHHQVSSSSRGSRSGGDINSYTLFDVLFDDDNNRSSSTTARQRSQQRRRRHHHTTTGGGPSTLSTSSSSSSNHNTTPTIIYAQKYQSPGALFMPILIFLSVTFVLLLVVRIVMSLLTAAVGIVVLCIIVTKFLHEFFTRPIRLIRNFHANPILCFCVLGSIFGVLHALWKQQLLPLLMHGFDEDSNESLISVISSWMPIESIGSIYAISTESSSVDLIMLWGLVRGLIYGIEVGCVWLIIFGDSSRPTPLTEYFYRTVWRPLKRQYKRTRIRQRTRQYYRCAPSTTSNTYGDGSDSSLGGSSDDRHQCVICFEPFVDTPEGGDRYQLLPCLHCFHRECARNWLVIRQSCPICRVKVEGMEGCGSVEWTNNVNDEED